MVVVARVSRDEGWGFWASAAGGFLPRRLRLYTFNSGVRRVSLMPSPSSAAAAAGPEAMHETDAGRAAARVREGKP